MDVPYEMGHAMYYPHKAVRSDGVLRTALLTWDSLSIIAPRDPFTPDYRGNVARANAWSALKIPDLPNQHVPTEEDQKKAHPQIKNFAKSALGKSLHGSFRLIPDSDLYELDEEKLSESSWKLLLDADLVGVKRKCPQKSWDYPTDPRVGQIIMSILTNCMAGSTYARVTDLPDFHRGMMRYLNDEATARKLEDISDKESSVIKEVIQIGISVVDPDGLTLEQLTAFRDEERTFSDDHKALRQSLRASLRNFANEQVNHVIDSSGRSERTARLHDCKAKFKTDFGDLRRELRIAKNDDLLFKVIVVPAVAVGSYLSSIAAKHYIGAFHDISPVIPAMTSLPTIGALLGPLVSFPRKTEDLMRKHPTAYMLEAKQQDVSTRHKIY